MILCIFFVWLDLILEAKAKIMTKFLLIFGKNWSQEKLLLRFSDFQWDEKIFSDIVVADTRIVQKNVKVYQIKVFCWCLGAIKVAFLFETPF